MADVSLEPVAGGRYRLVGQLTFDTVPTLLESEALRGVLADQTRIELDLSRVERGDSAGLALLVSWVRSARLQDKQLVLMGVSEQLSAMAQVCGLTDILSLDSVSSSPPAADERQ